MVAPRVFAAALLSAAVWAGESPAAGKWSCTNESSTGAKSSWTLVIREEGSKLAGFLSDGEAEIALADVRLDGEALTFRFHINGKPYTFEGKAGAKELAGKYSGEEASGALRCEKPAR